MLIGVKGDVLPKAISLQPTLLIDCDMCANPFRLFPDVTQEELSGVYVVGVEIIYGLRDALKRADMHATRLGCSTIAISRMNRLFNYGDEDENHDVYEHSWEIIKSLAEKYTVVVCTDGMESYL
jgi:uncharacterized protein YerC